MKLRQKSLIALLENNQFLRKSIAGFRQDLPLEYALYKTACEEVGAYEMLELFVNRASEMDAKYMIWAKMGALPLIFEVKEAYSDTETSVISRKTKIPLEVFKETIAAVNK